MDSLNETRVKVAVRILVLIVRYAPDKKDLVSFYRFVKRFRLLLEKIEGRKITEERFYNDSVMSVLAKLYSHMLVVYKYCKEVHLKANIKYDCVCCLYSINKKFIELVLPWAKNMCMRDMYLVNDFYQEIIFEVWEVSEVIKEYFGKKQK